MIDNLTTALVMGAVVVALGVGNYQFIVMGCIIIVVAANAGGVLLAVRRYHLADGLAERQAGVLGILPPLPAGAGELPRAGDADAFRRAERNARGGERTRNSRPARPL